MTDNDFNQNPTNPQQLNIKKMSILELVSRFMMFHQAGRFEQARPYLSELVDRQDAAEAEGADATEYHELDIDELADMFLTPDEREKYYAGELDQERIDELADIDQEDLRGNR